MVVSLPQVLKPNLHPGLNFLTIHMKKISLQLLISVVCVANLYAQSFVTEKKYAGALPLISAGEAATIYVDIRDHAVVQKTAAMLQQDIERVTGVKPLLQTS